MLLHWYQGFLSHFCDVAWVLIIHKRRSHERFSFNGNKIWENCRNSRNLAEEFMQNFLCDWMQPGTLNFIQEHKWWIGAVDSCCGGCGSSVQDEILHQFARKINADWNIAQGFERNLNLSMGDLQLCKIDSEGKARKVVGCSCVVVKVWNYLKVQLHSSFFHFGVWFCLQINGLQVGEVMVIIRLFF
jgi:hypothetical protein